MLLNDENVTYREPIRCERSVNTQRTHLKRPTNALETPHIHSARRRGRFIVPVSPYYEICVCSLPFCGCLHICGHDKSAPTAADGLPITLRTHHETPNEHTARRRGRFIVPVSLHNQIYIFTLSNPYIHFIAHVCPHFKYVYSNRHTRIFVPHFVGVYIYAGTINRPLQQLVVCITLRTVCQQRNE